MEVLATRTAAPAAATCSLRSSEGHASTAGTPTFCGLRGACQPSSSSQHGASWKSPLRTWSRQFAPRQRQRLFAAEIDAAEVPAEEDITEIEEDTRDDRVLPDSLEDAVRQSAIAAARAVSSGSERVLVELGVPQLENLAEEGAQQRVYDCAREFIQFFQVTSGVSQIRVLLPDAGAAALLKHRWADAPFRIGSLNDRNPVQEDDEAVVLLSPDHTALDSVFRVCSQLEEDQMARPTVLYNPRLISGDVGIGLNVRRLQAGLLKSFLVAYALRPSGNGSVFRCYPNPWQVFLPDPDMPGRYLLAAETASRPTFDDLEFIVMGKSAEDEGKEAPSAGQQAIGVLASFSRFMKSLSN